MRRVLDVAFKDVSAGRLVYAFGGGPQPALATLAVDVGGRRLDLRVLGASHQVLLFDAAGAPVLSESVACGDDEGWLPDAMSKPVGGHQYRFRSAVEHHAPSGLAERARRIEAELANRRHALVGVFPGAPHAITGVAATVAGDTLGWRTWHAYPDTGELVLTWSEVR